MEKSQLTRAEQLFPTLETMNKRQLELMLLEIHNRDWSRIGNAMILKHEYIYYLLTQRLKEKKGHLSGSESANKRFIQLENGDLGEVLIWKFIPKDGEPYYFLNIGGGIGVTYNNSSADKWTIKHNLVFRTYEECEDYKKFLALLDEYSFKPNWDAPNQERWTMCFNHVEHRIEWLRLYAVQYHGFCFNSKERGEAFVDAVGTDVVEKYMFDYRE